MPIDDKPIQQSDGYRTEQSPLAGEFHKQDKVVADAQARTAKMISSIDQVLKSVTKEINDFKAVNIKNPETKKLKQKVSSLMRKSTKDLQSLSQNMKDLETRLGKLSVSITNKAEEIVAHETILATMSKGKSKSRYMKAKREIEAEYKAFMKEKAKLEKSYDKTINDFRKTHEKTIANMKKIARDINTEPSPKEKFSLLNFVNNFLKMVR